MACRASRGGRVIGGDSRPSRRQGRLRGPIQVAVTGPAQARTGSWTAVHGGLGLRPHLRGHRHAPVVDGHRSGVNAIRPVGRRHAGGEHWCRDPVPTGTATLGSSDPAVADTEPPATRTTGGNKFEPQRTGTQGTTPIGGQRHSGSMSIGSALGKIVKGIKTAVAHEWFASACPGQRTAAAIGAGTGIRPRAAAGVRGGKQ